MDLIKINDYQIIKNFEISKYIIWKMIRYGYIQSDGNKKTETNKEKHNRERDSEKDAQDFKMNDFVNIYKKNKIFIKSELNDKKDGVSRADYKFEFNKQYWYIELIDVLGTKDETETRKLIATKGVIGILKWNEEFTLEKLVKNINNIIKDKKSPKKYVNEFTILLINAYYLIPEEIFNLIKIDEYGRYFKINFKYHLASRINKRNYSHVCINFKKTFLFNWKEYCLDFYCFI